MCMHAVPCVASRAGMGMLRTHVPIIVHCISCIQISVLATHQCYPTHAECLMNVQTIYIFACMVFLVSQAFLGSECGGCMFQLLFTASHVSGHQLSRTPVLSDTCRLLNECADCIYICIHAVPCGSSMAGIGMWWTHVSIIVHCIPCIKTPV